MNPKERLQFLQTYTKLSLRALADYVGLESPQTFYDIRNGKHSFSQAVVDKICGKYNNISKLWLLTGEGNVLMAVEDAEEHDNRDKEIKATINQKGRTNKVFGGACNTVYESGLEEIIEVQEKRIAELESQNKKLEAQNSEYWEMIKSLMKK